jgi:hypothetical protein
MIAAEPGTQFPSALMVIAEAGRGILFRSGDPLLQDFIEGVEFDVIDSLLYCVKALVLPGDDELKPFDFTDRVDQQSAHSGMIGSHVSGELFIQFSIAVCA